MKRKIKVNLKFDCVRKVFILFIFSLASANVFSQNCKALFDAALFPANQTLALHDLSYRLDSASIPLDVLTWQWTITTPVSTIIDSVKNPIVSVNLSWNYVYVCLDINSMVNGTLCSDSYCDTVHFGNIPTYYCYTNFTSNINLATNTVDFSGSAVDQFSSPLNVTNYQWSFANGNPLNSSIQNPQIVFPGPGYYNICLITTTDTGCISTFCDSIQIIDTTSCGPNVGANVGHVTVPHGHDGYLEMIVSGGTQPYSYTWSGMVSSGPNAYNLSSGGYTVTISDANPLCPATSYTYHLLEPYDPLMVIVDTLTTNVIDTCFGFVADSFYIASIAVSGNIVYIDWVFTKNALSFNLTVSYTFTTYGAQMVFVTIDCNGTKNRTNYISYINIRQTTVEDYNTNDILVYPNPANDNITIHLEKPSNLIITDIFGKVICVFYDVASKKLDISSLQSGMYFLSDDKKTFVSKFIKE